MTKKKNTTRQVGEKGLVRITLIKETAARLFSKKGFSSVTTNEIAREANISIGSLYQYFPDKETILSAMAEDYREQVFQLRKELMLPSSRISHEEHLYTLFHGLYRIHKKQPAYRLILFGPETENILKEKLSGTDHEICGVIKELIHDLFEVESKEERELKEITGEIIFKGLLTVSHELNEKRMETLIRYLTQSIMNQNVGESGNPDPF